MVAVVSSRGKESNNFLCCRRLLPFPGLPISGHKGIAVLLLLIIVPTFFAHNDTLSRAEARRVYRVKVRRSNEDTNGTGAKNSANQQKPKEAARERKCTAHSDPQLHMLMDQICDLCHEMFSHVLPNLRAECSERCYKNAQFRKCLRMFSALPPGHPGGAAFTELLMRIEDDDDNDEGGRGGRGRNDGKGGGTKEGGGGGGGGKHQKDEIGDDEGGEGHRQSGIYHHHHRNRDTFA